MPRPILVPATPPQKCASGDESHRKFVQRAVFVRVGDDGRVLELLAHASCET